MCGICGYFARDPRTPPTVEILEAMLGAIAHRGPDDRGSYSDGHVALGQARLSIIDLAGGHQPIYNEDRTKCIVLNGEIYNYVELRRKLLSRGHVFSTQSDTEVVLHQFEEEGDLCVESINGMFAFAIWDGEARSLFLARDRLGKKPLYYKDTPSYFCFASEVKALSAAGLLGEGYDINAVDQFIALNYTIGPQTMFADVRKLMPGHTMTVLERTVRTREYWDFANVKPATAPFDECYARMESLIDEAVRDRLMSEVPLGAFLSGGVDSSLVVAVMTKLTGRPVKTFTVGYRDAPDVSELEYARLAARHLGSEHYEFILEPETFVDTVRDVVWHMDEPVGEYATIPLILLSRLAKGHVTVMLSGEGADEIFAGYGIYRYMTLVEQYRTLPGWLRDGVGSPLAGLLFGHRKEGKYTAWLEQPLERRYRGNGSYFTDPMRARVLRPDFLQSRDPERVQAVVDGYYQRVREKDPVSRMLYLDTKTWLPEDLLVKADKMTMAAGVELRVPFLDHRLVEFAASLPTGFKIRGRQGKFIMKKYAERLLPKRIVYRKKRGFPVPISLWMHGALGRHAREVLLDDRTRRRGILNVSYVEDLFQRHEARREDYSKSLWTLLVLEIWMRTFMDRAA